MEEEKKSEKERGNKQKTNSANSKSKSLNLTQPAKLVKLTGYTFFVQQKFDQNQGVNPKDLRR